MRWKCLDPPHVLQVRSDWALLDGLRPHAVICASLLFRSRVPDPLGTVFLQTEPARRLWAWSAAAVQLPPQYDLAIV